MPILFLADRRGTINLRSAKAAGMQPLNERHPRLSPQVFDFTASALLQLTSSKGLHLHRLASVGSN
jgi:hypothetical protein